jgi:NADPH-ferrihemoprotein reductase
LHEAPPEKLVGLEKGNQESHSDDAIILLLSCFGTGQPTENAKSFIQWLNSDNEAAKSLLRNRNYAVFGLGNSRTHKQNYNIVGKKADARLEELGGKRIHALGLGDDSECIEDDFDSWSKSLIETLAKLDSQDVNMVVDNASKGENCKGNPDFFAAPVPNVNEEVNVTDTNSYSGSLCLSELARETKSLAKASITVVHNFPELLLNDCYPAGRKPKKQLFDCPNFYAEGTAPFSVLSNRVLSPGQESLREAVLAPCGLSEGLYRVGDLLWIYPQNHPIQVAAYVRAMNMNPRAIIEGVLEMDRNSKPRQYPYPLGLTVHETLQHCVDLSASPSLSLARAILGQEVDYKTTIDEPRRTTLDLLLEPGSRKLSLSELLCLLPPMRPRYYSISSSPNVHPNEIRIVYRPVKYITSRGVLREGVATSYLSLTVPAFDDDERGEHYKTFFPTVAAGVMQNSGFSLPDNPSIPIVMIAGGCGIAPFRSFLEERLYLAQTVVEDNSLGEAYLFFGVRHEDDEVYRTIINHAQEAGAITKAIISHSNPFCGDARFVANDLEANGELIYGLLKRGGHIYLCGGATGLAWTSVNAIKAIIAQHGKMGTEEAENYFERLLQEGRYHEDISD